MVKEMSFQQFCDKISNNLDVIPESDSIYLANKSLISIANNIIRDFKNKTTRLDSLKMTYIVAAFDKYDEEDFYEELHRKTVDDEIPDELINYLSSGIYKMKYADMTTQQKNIIKVLAIYIILQI